MKDGGFRQADHKIDFSRGYQYQESGVGSQLCFNKTLEINEIT